MTKLEKIYCDAAKKVIDVEEEKTTAVANRVSAYVYEKHGYNAAISTEASDALCHAINWFFFDN